jgi:serine/threonine protein phosphatase 1
MTNIFTKDPYQKRKPKMYAPVPTNFSQFFSENTEGRDFIVSDLHGCFDEFENFLKRLVFDPWKDRMFCCGDLVDRGPKSRECLELLNNAWFYSVRGNHEQMMIESVLHNRNADLWAYNGGKWGVYGSHEERQELRSYVEMIEPYLPYIITVGTGRNRFNIVHAEFTFAPDISDKDLDTMEWDEYRCDSMLWGRDIIQGSPAPHSNELSITYVGHTPLVNPVRRGKHFYIDGGIVFGDKLHIVEHKAQVLHTYDAATKKYSQSNI